MFVLVAEILLIYHAKTDKNLLVIAVYKLGHFEPVYIRSMRSSVAAEVNQISAVILVIHACDPCPVQHARHCYPLVY